MAQNKAEKCLWETKSLPKVFKKIFYFTSLLTETSSSVCEFIAMRIISGYEVSTTLLCKILKVRIQNHTGHKIKLLRRMAYFLAHIF